MGFQHCIWFLRWKCWIHNYFFTCIPLNHFNLIIDRWTNCHGVVMENSRCIEIRTANFSIRRKRKKVCRIVFMISSIVQMNCSAVFHFQLVAESVSVHSSPQQFFISGYFWLIIFANKVASSAVGSLTMASSFVSSTFTIIRLENLNQTLKEPWVKPKIIWRIIEEPRVLVHAIPSARQLIELRNLVGRPFLVVELLTMKSVYFLWQGVKESKQGLNRWCGSLKEACLNPQNVMREQSPEWTLTIDAAVPCAWFCHFFFWPRQQSNCHWTMASCLLDHMLLAIAMM